MKRETLFLKLAVIIIGIPVLALCLLGLNWLANNPIDPNYINILYPILMGMYVSAIPFYFALYQAFKILSYIDKNIAFSEFSIRALRSIKFCAIIIGSVYAVMLPFVYLLQKKVDPPGLLIIGMFPIFASMVIAVFSAVLQKLLKNAIDIKSENDLTV